MQDFKIAPVLVMASKDQSYVQCKHLVNWFWKHEVKWFDLPSFKKNKYYQEDKFCPNKYNNYIINSLFALVTEIRQQKKYYIV